MDVSRALELLDKQIEDARDGQPQHFSEWRNKTEVVIRMIFGELSPTHRKFTDVRYTPSMRMASTDTSGFRVAGVRQVVAILEGAKLELEIAVAPPTESPVAAVGENNVVKKVFIVHGRDDARKFELSSFLQTITGEQPVILHQQSNGGQVLIEKLEEHGAAAAFAVVLLTADDVGGAKELDAVDWHPRARQNVVFEMGFFFGLIGRQRVAVLYESGVELPSDINGLVYTELDAAGGWKPKLAAELSRADIAIDWAKLALG